MSVNKAIDSIIERNLDEMRNNFNSAITTKAVEKLEERKIEIAQSYFGQMVSEENLEEEHPSNLRIQASMMAKKYGPEHPKAVAAAQRAKEAAEKLKMKKQG